MMFLSRGYIDSYSLRANQRRSLRKPRPYDLHVKGQGHYRSPGVAAVVSDVTLIEYHFEYCLFFEP